MFNFSGFCLILLYPLIFISNSGLSQDFPTDNGSLVISGSFSKKSSKDTPFEYYEKRVDLSGSLAYMIFMDVSLGVWVDYEKISSGSSYRTDRALGPQFTWYIGGHTHRPQLGGNFYQYLGLSVLNRKWKQNRFNCDSTGCRYELLTHSSYVYRPFFGLMIMINNNIGIFGEASIQLFNRRRSGGCIIVDGPAGESALDIGLIIFLY